jgi:sugar-phosphatase
MPKHMITSTDVQRGKPDPEPYLKAAQLLGFPPADCIVVEDAPAGIRAGKASGARVLALRTTAPDPELTQSGATWIANDLSWLRFEAVNSNYADLLLLNDSANH